MNKNSSADSFFDDGLWYKFIPTNISHVHVEVNTPTPDADNFPNGYETCDLRLASLIP